MSASYQISAAQASDLDDVRRLFRAYADSLGIELDYQHFDDELASLPGKYAPPLGALLIARNEVGGAVGCVALRPFDDDGACEMKRMYVAPAGRGQGLGRALGVAILEEASQLGYREMLLDTLPTLKEAVALYHSLGFVRVDAYYDTPIAETLFMKKSLPAAYTKEP